jgi:hypothetical protein
MNDGPLSGRSGDSGLKNTMENSTGIAAVVLYLLRIVHRW